MSDAVRHSHFLRLARRGKPNSGPSGGEVRARNLALSILENVRGLDDDAVEGAIAFLRLVAYTDAPSLLPSIVEEEGVSHG